MADKMIRQWDNMALASANQVALLDGIKKSTMKLISQKYSVIRILGEGGNATVVEAERLADRKRVAIKILRNCSPEKKERFGEEIRILTEWSPKIEGMMPIQDSHECDDGYWYEMPITNLAESKLCDLDIKDRIDKSVEIIRQCATTLGKLHKHGISHRDIKPDNIHCWNNTFVIGDFGLVEAPESKELTLSDKALGAVFTMAPEMRRNPKVADGRKADVYSLAKTLWMFIKNDRYGFDGPYDWTDEKIGLHQLSSAEHKLHLSELELLLRDATDNNPDSRPTMAGFLQRLDWWVEVDKDPLKVQTAEWDFLKLNIFGRCVPRVALFTDYDTIFRIMKMLCHTPALNHTIFSYHGGLDLVGVEKSAEQGCITLLFDYDTVILKPKSLQVGVFEESELNYFLLDVAAQSAIDGVEMYDGIQSLVEDIPGHYVSGVDAVYGVYDYDSGVPFPAGWRTVTRLVKGRLLMVSKSGPYNSISRIYDGRHGDCSMPAFQKYMEKIEQIINAIAAHGYNWRKINLAELCGLDKNPFKPNSDDSTPAVFEPSPPQGFLTKNLSSWQFLGEDTKPYIKDGNGGNFSFALTANQFYIGAKSSSRKYNLGIDGRLHEHPSVADKIFTMERLSDARRLLPILQAQYDRYCEPYNQVDSEIDYSFKIRIERIPNSKLRLSNMDIYEKAMAANDRIYNRFVIDETGELLLLSGEESRNAAWYPVRMECFEPRSNNVGRYSIWSPAQVEEYYNAMQGAWNQYCDTKRFIYRDWLSC